MKQAPGRNSDHAKSMGYGQDAVRDWQRTTVARLFPQPVRLDGGTSDGGCWTLRRGEPEKAWMDLELRSRPVRFRKLETRWRMARHKRLFTWQLLPFSTGSRPRVFDATPVHP